jgi:hypothetical protein
VRRLPYEYYSLPFCKPEGAETVAENLGEVLRGDKIMNSLYELKMGVEESCKVLCRKALTQEEATLFSQRVEEDYRVTDMIVDNLPAATCVPREAHRDGTPPRGAFCSRPARASLTCPVASHRTGHGTPRASQAHRRTGDAHLARARDHHLRTRLPSRLPRFGGHPRHLSRRLVPVQPPPSRLQVSYGAEVRPPRAVAHVRRLRRAAQRGAYRVRPPVTRG